MYVLLMFFLLFFFPFLIGSPSCIKFVMLRSSRCVLPLKIGISLYISFDKNRCPTAHVNTRYVINWNACWNIRNPMPSIFWIILHFNHEEDGFWKTLEHSSMYISTEDFGQVIETTQEWMEIVSLQGFSRKLISDEWFRQFIVIVYLFCVYLFILSFMRKYCSSIIVYIFSAQKLFFFHPFFFNIRILWIFYTVWCHLKEKCSYSIRECC